MLVMGFALPVFDHKRLKNLLDSGTYLSFGAVTYEAVHCPTLADFPPSELKGSLHQCPLSGTMDLYFDLHPMKN